ncbi:MAG: oligosaccharide flippase family protein [Cypionkella sp.]
MFSAIKYVFASVFGKVANLIIVFVLAHGLTTAEFGQYFYILNLVGVFMLIGQLGLPLLVVREVAKGSQRPLIRKGIIYFSVAVNALALIAIMTFLASARSLISLGEYEALSLGLILFFYSFAAIAGSVLAGLNRVYEGAWPDTMLRSLLLVAGVGFLALFQPQWLNIHVLLGLLALSHAATLLTLVWNLRTLRADLLPTGTPELRTWPWLKSTFILGGASIATLLNSRVDILMLERMTGLESLATYAFSLQFVIFFTFPYVVVSSFLLPRLSEFVSRDRSRAHADYALGSTAIVAITALVSAAMLGFTWIGWDLVVPPAFEGAKLLIRVFAIFYLANTLFGPVIIYLTAGGMETSVFVVSILSGVVNVALNFLLIPVLAETGAALATMISMTMMNAAMFVIVMRRFGRTRVIRLESLRTMVDRVSQRYPP